MPTAHPETIAEGILCIDTGLYRPGLAACYLVRSADRLAFVDTGTEHSVPALLALIERLGLSPEHVDYVIPTHVHLDHAGGAGALMAACPNARLVVHPKGAPHLIDPARLIAGASAVYGAEAFKRDFGGLQPIAAERVILAEDGQSFDLAGRRLTFIDTPGHANHHGCILDSLTGGLFSGDTFGISYREFDTDAGPWLYAPTTPVAFDPDLWLASLDKLMALKPSAVYLTHYGRLDAPERHVERLRQSIRDLAALALVEEGRDDGARGARLRAAVGAHLAASARAHGVEYDEARLGELLAVDTELNAQGLEVWLKRREKAATA
ncbi:MAG: MBL fold metallo-hydrolase [Chromatiaceae bacterium]|nr:MBL fold metallo-hydrolase [Chromatiaceae bacterium]